MKETIFVLLILFIHFFCDFVLQTDKQAKGKSNNWNDLLSHTLTYSLFTTICWCILFPIHVSFPYYYLKGYMNPFYLFFITLVCHTITDYFTSRLNSKLWAEGNTHGFFVSVGFDQLLHFVQLLLTYQLLK